MKFVKFNKKHIPPYALELREDVGKVIFPEDLLEIGSWAFNGCKNLKEIKLPESLWLLGDGAFANCKALQELVIPKGITVIPARLCAGCTSLKRVVLPSTVQFISEGAFDGCPLTLRKGTQYKTGIHIPDNCRVHPDAFGAEDEDEEEHEYEDEEDLVEELDPEEVQVVPDEVYDNLCDILNPETEEGHEPAELLRQTLESMSDAPILIRQEMPNPCPEQISDTAWVQIRNGLSNREIQSLLKEG